MHKIGNFVVTLYISGSRAPSIDVPDVPSPNWALGPRYTACMGVA